MCVCVCVCVCGVCVCGVRVCARALVFVCFCVCVLLCARVCNAQHTVLTIVYMRTDMGKISPGLFV